MSVLFFFFSSSFPSIWTYRRRWNEPRLWGTRAKRIRKLRIVSRAQYGFRWINFQRCNSVDFAKKVPVKSNENKLTMRHTTIYLYPQKYLMHRNVSYFSDSWSLQHMVPECCSAMKISTTLGEEGRKRRGRRKPKKKENVLRIVMRFCERMLTLLHRSWDTTTILPVQRHWCEVVFRIRAQCFTVER